MENLPPIPPPVERKPSSFFQEGRFSQTVIGWEVVEPRPGSSIPCQRSLHAGAVWRDQFLVFGGYDVWRVLNNTDAPSPRDRHVAVVFSNSLYIFGGFDGVARVNDLHAYDLERNKWQMVTPTAGALPTARHSHSAVVYQDSMYIFGGYDGSYRSDFHSFNFYTKTWRQIQGQGEIPRARYRGTCVVCGESMILHGGHDGTRHLQDTHIFDFPTSTWSTLITEGPIPSPRDSHVAVIYGKSMYLYGGSTGSAMGDFHELKLEFRRVWKPIVPSLADRDRRGVVKRSGFSPYSGETQQKDVITPGARFCHVGVVYEGSFYIFGGYDGSNRLNDFLRYQFKQHEENLTIPPPTILTDLKKYVNNDLLSDVQFVVEGQPIYAHKILCLRCPFFYNMLTGEYMESRASAITIEDIKFSTFLLLLEYLYTDEVNITVDTAMELFQAADRFGIDRLKTLCEQEMLNAIDIETAAHILFTADHHNADNLRSRCMDYIVQHFDRVSITAGFEEMGRTNVELLLEILRKRAPPGVEATSHP